MAKANKQESAAEETLLQLIMGLRIDPAKAVFGLDATISGYGCDFEILPKDFLNYSKHDFKLNNLRGNVNALSNAKRAIDCQIDKILMIIGIGNNKIPSTVTSFISGMEFKGKKDLPIKLRLLQALNFAPGQIISNIRNLRNQLEHYYKQPTSEQVSNAIDVAELFIGATDAKLDNICTFYFSDENKFVPGHLANSIYVEFFGGGIEVRSYGDERRTIVFSAEHAEYFHLLKMATSLDYEEDLRDSFADLLNTIGHGIPRHNVSLTVSHEID